MAYVFTFDELDAAQIARLDAVVAAAQASRDEAWSLTPNIFERGWANLIGADSTANALVTNAKAADALLATLQAKRDRLAADPYATEYDVLEMEGARYAMGNEASRGASYQLSSGAVYDQVVKKTGQDVVDKVNNPFGVPLGLWVAGGLAIYLFAKGLR